MNYKINHIVPFDIGYSFFDFEYRKKLTKSSFLNALSNKCAPLGIRLNTHCASQFLCVATISDSISCFLHESGVGIFFIEGDFPVDYKEVDAYFSDEPACKIYYRKKYEQQLILYPGSHFPEIQLIHQFMETVWNCVPYKMRPYSASSSYKHHGLSYVLSVYHLFEDALSPMFSNDWILLMNPSIMSNILIKDHWESIRNKSHLQQEHQTFISHFSESTDIYSSWSAVAVVENKESLSIERIIKYEILLQASWFLFDCLMDNINHMHFTNVDLHICKSLASNVSLEISIISSANISTNEMTAYSNIYTTSGTDLLYQKLTLLLDNRISIEDAKTQQKQTTYGIITEILLVLFTLVSIYEPLSNLLSGQLTKNDLLVGGIMMLTLLISAIFIIGKEHK